MSGYLNSSVKLSAERILLHGPSHPQFENDAHKVASAVFQLVDDTPASWEWLIHIGADVDYMDYFKKLFDVVPETLVGMPVPVLRTKGKVRHLCEVLNVPTKGELQ